jgi:uncharacterized membrane protein
VPKVEKSICINVPVETAYTLIADQPERMKEWWPPIELQERVTPPPTIIGSRSQYVYNMLGIKIKGEHEVLQLTPNEHLYVKTLTGIDSTFDFRFERVDSTKTQITISVDYRLPGSVLGRILDKVLLERENVKNLEQGLENLKTILEAETVS